MTLPFWRIHRTIGMGGDKLVAEVAGDEVEERLGDDAARRLARGVRQDQGGGPRRSPARPTWSSSSPTDGYLVALASSGDPEFADEALDDLDIRDDVAVLKTSSDVDDSKPEPDLVDVTLEAVGTRRAVLIGDTPYDVESAERAGLKCIGLRSGGYSEAELVDAGAVLVVDAPEDLMDVDWEKYLLARDERRRMTNFGYTLMTEQTGPRELVGHAVRAEGRASTSR